MRQGFGLIVVEMRKRSRAGGGIVAKLPFWQDPRNAGFFAQIGNNRGKKSKNVSKIKANSRQSLPKSRLIQSRITEISRP